MLNIQRQIEYWIKTASEDMVTAELLMSKNRVLHSLFFCHLTIEKAIKAHFVKKTGQFAPKTHNLFLLNEQVKLNFSEDEFVFLGILMKYQLEGRYPDYEPAVPSVENAKSYLKLTKQLFIWLKEEL
ncbi:MAG: HEPN domain-containing protein [Petrimonas sp.]|nr:HEPN domain-containing protein [Petrimonas sp.]